MATFIDDQWTLSLLGQHWWSFAGDGPALEANYSVLREDDLGAKWVFRLKIIPVVSSQ